LLASRPKTWIAGISPVLIGTALSGIVSWPLFFCSLAFSLFIQIGTNYSNDYYDFINGADTHRVGPTRFVASGQIALSAMKAMSLWMFGLSFFVSLPLVHATGLWALAFIFSSIAFGILYTGGPKPLGYIGLGELLVLIYFGPIAVCGAAFVQAHVIDLRTLCLSLSPGLLSCAILIANNLRDEETDRRAGKNTLIVRFGRTFGIWEYAFCVSAALIIPLFFSFYTPLGLMPLALILIRKSVTFQSSGEAAPLLPQTAMVLILFTLLLCIEI
jgi:1,4-dihydroxy-2-naphthoate octaprenyltransferase